MIKEINSSQLITGMYVHKLHCSWAEHPFMRNKFLINNATELKKILDAKIRIVSIDTDKGKDLSQQKTEKPAAPDPVEENITPDPEPNLEKRVAEAKNLVKDASGVVVSFMTEVKLGNQIDLEITREVASSITRMLSKDTHTLLGVSRLKTKDEYTFIHSVSVSALVAAFAKGLDYSPKEIDQIALGGLLHDIGKALTPNKILNKPGKLTNDEFVIMRQHAIDEQNDLLSNYDLPQNALDVITMHHERPDGKGYPLGLKDSELSEVGKMSAIVDIYDALTSVRIYKDAWEPTLALKTMLGWCPGQLDEDLMRKFIKILGIYPVGSLVELESGKVGLVTEQCEDLLRPILKIIFDSKQRSYVSEYELNLLEIKQEKVMHIVTPSKYKIDVASYI
ncbi:MAG: HD-GYP domain-containing protein [Gammaproteobacteria bacterium]